MISVIISLNTLVMHVTKIIFFLRQIRHADYYHRYYNHRDRHNTFGIEIVMIIKNFSFH